MKAFNHIYAADLTKHGQAVGTKNRRALVIAGDDAQAKAQVAHLLDQFGFDTVDAGPLKEGWRIQRDTPGYGPRRTADELRRDLAAARRYAGRIDPRSEEEAVKGRANRQKTVPEQTRSPAASRRPGRQALPPDQAAREKPFRERRGAR